MWPPDYVTFLTLTYEEECLPKDGLLKKRDLQLFWKRLRENSQRSIRYFCSGEYGSTNLRPHYHAICYGLPLKERNYILEAWKMGFVKVALCNSQTFRYVAKYVMKDMNTMIKHFEAEYFGEALLPNTERYFEAPPFALMSRNPGLGKPFLEKMANGLRKSGNSWTHSALTNPTPWSFRFKRSFYPLDSHCVSTLKVMLGADYQHIKSECLVKDLMLRKMIWGTNGKAPHQKARISKAPAGRDNQNTAISLGTKTKTNTHTTPTQTAPAGPHRGPALIHPRSIPASQNNNGLGRTTNDATNTKAKAS